jgi:hypothetical protein
VAYTQTGGTVNLNGTLEVDNGSTGGPIKPMTGGYVGASLQGGTLCGTGTIQGSLLAQGGTLAPGAGTLTITGNYTQQSGGTLLIQLVGTGAGQSSTLAVGGTATLGGTLDVELGPGFTPAVGEVFAFLTASSVAGNFGAFTGLDLGNGLQLLEVSSATGLDLIVPGPGDANSDGRVDINDLTIVLTHYNMTGMVWSDGEFTGDGTVDINDLTIVLADYGRTYTYAGALHAVPEPAGLVLLGIGAGGLLACAWRRRRV